MTNIKAMKLALDALRSAFVAVEQEKFPITKIEVERAIAALRQAISEAELNYECFRPMEIHIKEQAEQEHDGHWSDCSVHNEPAYPNGECDCGGYPPKAAQEPVAWLYRGELHWENPSEWATREVTPLYTAPPQREWVSLTDDEIIATEDVIDWTDYEWSDKPTIDFSRAIEAKLKEKNHD